MARTWRIAQLAQKKLSLCPGSWRAWFGALPSMALFSRTAKSILFPVESTTAPSPSADVFAPRKTFTPEGSHPLPWAPRRADSAQAGISSTWIGRTLFDTPNSSQCRLPGLEQGLRVYHHRRYSSASRSLAAAQTVCAAEPPITAAEVVFRLDIQTSRYILRVPFGNRRRSTVPTPSWTSFTRNLELPLCCRPVLVMSNGHSVYRATTGRRRERAHARVC